MKKKFLSGIAAGALAFGIMASSGFAAVTFDPSTGTGFVGKGDVQSSLGFNNAHMQREANNLVFSYESVEKYEVTVEWTTGEGTKGEKTHTVEHKVSSFINSDVNYDSRKAKQYTGFNLTGLGNTIEAGTFLKVSDEYPGNSGHIVTSVNLISSTGTLYVNGVPLQ
ncbi:hypothetical protein [Neobacillus mesonae]|uniref:Uncharacterized protein n=1 Tax=Neobacillus mesonae TaxID=1193713 RepID=A0A3T0HTZ8_9BACI|nr:hypothetical protein [Neobacillus mesonae]AZU60573.1 hypothetical protein CHR53_04430 [Neobacillus mesonae]